MSLYRKYRPLTFDDLVGQQHIEKTLRNALEQDRLAHAFLFSGPRGTGKTTTARILAKALLCEKGTGPNPDGHCEDCELIAEGRHPDVLELDAASQTGVDNVREEIISRLNYAPQRGAYKIYIIDEVHMLSTGAFNAMLKTLEEPPAHVVFILCTTNPQAIPETIRSRCQRFDFRPIASQEIAKNLQLIAEKEGVEAEPEAIRLIARHAAGGMRDAITLFEQLISYSDGKITVAEVEQSLGEISSDALFELMTFVAERKSSEALHWVAAQVERGTNLIELIRSLIAYVRDVYVLKVVENSEALIELGVDEIASREELAKKFEGPERLTRILTMLSETAAQMRYSTEARMLLELCLVRLIQVEDESDIQSYRERIERLEALLLEGFDARTALKGGSSRSSAEETPARPAVTEVSAPAAVSAPSPQPPVAEPVATETEPAAKLAEHETPASALAEPAQTPVAAAAPAPKTARNYEREWRELLSAIRKKRPAMIITFSPVIPSLGERGELVLSWPKDQEFHFKAAKNQQSLIEDAMKDSFGEVRDYRLALGLSETVSAAPTPAPSSVEEAPAYEAPAYEAPVYEAPEYEAPGDEVAVSEAPAYEAPQDEPASVELPQEEEAPTETAAESPAAEADLAPLDAVPHNLDDDIAANLDLLGATVTEIRDANGLEIDPEEIAEENPFIDDPEAHLEFDQERLF